MTTWKEAIDQYKEELEVAREIKELHSWLNDSIEFEMFAENYVIEVNKKANQNMTKAGLKSEQKR